jgi:Tol biopolymer transport system component
VAAVAVSALSNVWVLPAADPLHGRQITFGNLPMFDVTEAPDGKILSAGGDGALWVTNTDGTQHSRFTDASGAGWITPCVHSVVFTSFKPGIVTLMRVDIDGSNAKELTSGSLWSPSCSPDGRFVFYVSVDSPQRIWRIPVEGGTRAQIAVVQGDTISGRMKGCSRRRTVVTTASFAATEKCRTAQRDLSFRESAWGRLDQFLNFPHAVSTIGFANSSTGNAVRFPQRQRERRSPK